MSVSLPCTLFCAARCQQHMGTNITLQETCGDVNIASRTQIYKVVMVFDDIQV